MGRKLKNDFVEIQIKNTNQTYRRFEVKVPFPVNVEFRPLHSKGNKHFGTVVKAINASYFEKEKIAEFFRNHGYEVVDLRQLKIWLTELCPQCGELGIPKVERKDTTDNRIRSGRYDNDRPKLAKRPDEYWVTYDHPAKSQKCRIQQYQGTESNTFKPNKFKKIDFRKFLLEDAVEFIK